MFSVPAIYMLHLARKTQFCNKSRTVYTKNLLYTRASIIACTFVTKIIETGSLF